MLKPAPVFDFIALCVHSTRMGLVYVKDGDVYDKAFLFDTSEDLADLVLYFDKVQYVIAFNIGVHRANLRRMFERNGLALPDKKYVCIYNWAKDNIGTTTFDTVRDYFGIGPDSADMDFDGSGWHFSNYVLNAEMVAEAAILLQESCGLVLEQAVSGDRASHQRKFWEYMQVKHPLPDFKYYEGEISKSLFVSQRFVITGEFFFNSYRAKIIKQLEDFGAVSQSSVNSKTDIFIVGKDSGAVKLIKLKDLLARGADIKILNEGHLIGCVK